MTIWMPQYQTYYGIHVNDHTEAWGGYTFNKVLVTDYPDTNLRTTDTTSAYNVNLDFLYPPLVQSTYYLDGVLDGILTFKNTSATLAHWISAYVVSLNKLGLGGTLTSLGSYSFDFGTNVSLPLGTYLTLPVFIDLDKQAVNENEKLLFRIACTCENSSDFCLSHYNDQQVSDLKIRIPFAPTE